MVGLVVFVAIVVCVFIRAPLRTVAVGCLFLALVLGMALPYAQGIVYAIILGYVLLALLAAGVLVYWSLRRSHRKGGVCLQRA